MFVLSMLQVHLGDTPNNLTERDFEDLARKTDGFSGSDISVCVSTQIQYLDVAVLLSFFYGLVTDPIYVLMVFLIHL